MPLLTSRRRLSRPLTESPESTTLSEGDLYHAIPHHRSLYLTALGLRILSIALSIAIIGILVNEDRYMFLGFIGSEVFYLGIPTAALALLWSFLDVVILLFRDRGLTLHAAARSRKRKGRRAPASAFCWATPAVHVSAHVVIWVVTLVMNILLWIILYGQVANNTLYVNDAFSATEAIIDVDSVWSVPSLQIPLMLIHFSLFVLACVATDDKVRGFSDVVFIPKDQAPEEEVQPLPSSLWDVLRPKKLPMAVSVNQYVRFLPAADGTVRVARDFGKPSD